MNTYYLIMFFIFGTIFGSFYNVLANRIPRNESVSQPRSHCENCQHILSWYELIPIISYVIQKGKCRNCKTKLSFFYPFAEIATGILFLVSYYSFGFSYDLIVALTISSTFILVLISDLNYLIIPDRFIIVPSIIVIVVIVLKQGFLAALIQIGYGLIGFLLMYLIMLLGNFMFKKESLGGADIKLMFLTGLVLNPMLLIVVLFLASIIALPISLFLLLKNKEHVIPYGPFIMVSLLIVYFTKLNIEQLFLKILNFF